MIGIDTNVLLRSIVRDREAMAEAADRFLASLTPEEPGFVSGLAVCEIAWSMRRSYGYDRQAVVRALRGILAAAELRVERATVVADAVDGLETGGAGFSDQFIAALHADAGADATVTLDRTASRLRGWRLLV